MTFLNPAVLLAILAAALPILIHLLNLRKRKPIQFSSLQLVRELQKSSLRRFKLHQWLLLALRSLAILFLVGSFSKPVLEGYLAGAGFSARTRTSAFILLDSSPSMQYTDQKGHDQWRQAKLAALKILDNLGSDDQIFLSLARSGETFSQPTTPSEARQRIVDAEISYTATPTQDRLREGLKVLANSKNFNRELYIVSDFHPAGFLSQDTSFVADKAFSNIKLYLIDTGVSDKQNTGLIESEVLTKIFEPDKAVQVRATYQISGQKPNDELIAELRFNDKLAKENTLSADSTSLLNTTFSATPRENGFISSTVSLPDDNYAPDNKRYSVFFIPERLRLLLVYSDLSEIDFLKRAFESYENRPDKNHQYFEITYSPEQRLDEWDFSRFDAVIFGGTRNISSVSMRKMADYIEQGGGLLFFAPPGIENYNPHNSLLTSIGGGRLSPERPEVKGSPRSIDRIDYRHPLFEGVFVRSAIPRTEGSSAVQITQDFPKLLNGATYQKSSNESVLASCSGMPLATTLNYGAGKCIIFSTVPSVQTTTLVLDPIFAPLLFRSVFWVTSKTRVSTKSITVGNPDEIVLPQAIPPGEKLVVKKPDGKTFIPELRQHAGSTRLSLKPEFFDIPGIYDVVKDRNGSGENAADRVTLLAFNVSQAESEQKKLPLAVLKKTVAQTGIAESNIFHADAIASAEAVTKTISDSRFGFGIWKYLVGLAAACLIAESILGRKIAA